MRTGFIAVVVLCFTVHSPAYAQDPVPVGVQCVKDCLLPNATDSDDGSSGYQSMGSYGGASYQQEENDWCIYFEKKMTCVVGCQVEKYTVLAREHIRIYGKYCGDNVDPASTKKFFATDDQFVKEWTSEALKCDKNTTTPEEYCTHLSQCLFGCALTLGKNGFCSDIVSTNVIFTRMIYAVKLETNTTFGGNLPSSCNQLFVPFLPDPNQPETPCEPKPDQHNSYQRGSYQRGSYQRNSYQRKPYQRNPYRRNPYQRNPYKRNSYPRSPY
ncbi:hypothetical protein AAVH_28789 [Aphelenchoides avenae]|nr:hypothetical protein AAVH_28789 [Aphelenchus avenae]